ncbi:aromatic acid exporter family protein [Paenibacillus sp. DYY-L-2]|uniref:aromatic acid exporter family protein n=1 Tax=Paenibacillus sp. DYY-L-2 TaxID=3447013 RepID=UPI003F5069DA
MGFRVIKTAIATLLAVVVAEAAGVEGANSAGLLAILGVDVTRKRSIASVSSRFFASLLGVLLAFLLFYLFGFHLWVLGLYILIGFPLISRAHFKEGIVTSSVVVFRVFGGEELSFSVFLTQVELLVIGLGAAMLVNFAYMPKAEDKLMSIRKRVDGLFAVIFAHCAKSLRDPYYIWDGRELIEAEQLVEDGLSSSKLALENQLISPSEAWSVYFYMRKEQLGRIESMLELISQVYQRMPQGEITALLFDRLSEDVICEEYKGQTEKMLFELEKDFKRMELPSTREEFEIRSALLQLCRELGQFLNIAKRSKAPASLRKGKTAGDFADGN